MVDPIPAIRLLGLMRAFGDVVAVDGVDLDVLDGEFLTLLGPSGSGKTTVLRMIAGFERPDGGTIELAGTGITTLPIWIYQNLVRPNQAPIVNVVAAALVLVSILPIYIAQRFSNTDERGGGLI